MSILVNTHNELEEKVLIAFLLIAYGMIINPGVIRKLKPFLMNTTRRSMKLRPKLNQEIMLIMTL